MHDYVGRFMYFILNKLYEQDTVVSDISSSIANKGLMSEEETANYLTFSQDKFNSLITYEESERKKVTGYDTTVLYLL